MIFDKLILGPLGASCFVIGDEKTGHGLVIDPGDELNTITTTLTKHNLTLKYILITHGHVDHITQVSPLKDATGATTIMHKADHFLLSHASVQAMMFGLPDPGKPVVDKFVDEGDVIEMDGVRLDVLHTPGHSPGSITFKLPDDLIVGDLIFAGSIGRTDLPGGDYDTLIQSVKSKIFTLDEGMKIHPGHGPATTVGHEKATNPFFK